MTVHRHGFYYFTPSQENNIFNSIFIYNNRKSLHTTTCQLRYYRKCLSMYGSVSKMQPLQLSVWYAAGGRQFCLFRRPVHFRWLSTVHDWEKGPPEFREEYDVMYRIYECLGCRRRYKDMPGYVTPGKVFMKAQETQITLAIVRRCVEA